MTGLAEMLYMPAPVNPNHPPSPPEMTNPSRIAESSTNRVADGLRFAVLSRPIQPSGGVARWLRARVDGFHGSGRFRVRFVGERLAGGRLIEVTEPVDDPALLEDCDAVRIQIEFDVGPGEAWSPPRVDSVELFWE